jgi:hypothetical protein
LIPGGSLLSENPGIENRRNFEHSADSVTNFDCEMLRRRTLQDTIARGVDKRPDRLVVRRLGVQEFNALSIHGKRVVRPEVEKELSHLDSRLFWRLQAGRIRPVVEVHGGVGLAGLPQQFVSFRARRKRRGFIAHSLCE